MRLKHLRMMLIGGGNLRTGETRRIDERIVAMAAKAAPQVLLVPTASADNATYIEAFRALYEAQLGCRLDVLTAPFDNAPARMASADIIYVGGGDTLAMLRAWECAGISNDFRTAAARGAVCAGLSAGAIAWFACGHSDALRERTGANPWEYLKVPGLGVLPGLFCPHYHREAREADLARMVQDTSMPAVALDDNTALEIDNGQWRVYRSRRSGKAWLIEPAAQGVNARRLPADHAWRALTELFGPTAA